MSLKRPSGLRAQPQVVSNTHKRKRGKVTRKHNSAATLIALPVEILDIICEYLLRDPGDEWKRGGKTYHMWSLRLTCYTIHDKIIDIFAKHAFGHLMVKNNPHDF